MKQRIFQTIAMASIMGLLSGCCMHFKTSSPLSATKPEITVVSDSILDIISNGRITAVNHSQFMVKGDSVINIGSKDAAVVRFLVLDPENYMSDDPSFGMFVPSVDYQFHDGKRSVTASFDFGNSKWSLSDASGARIITRDLRSGELLRFSRILFPNDSLLNKISEK